MADWNLDAGQDCTQANSDKLCHLFESRHDLHWLQLFECSFSWYIGALLSSVGVGYWSSVPVARIIPKSSAKPKLLRTLPFIYCNSVIILRKI